MKIEVKVHPKSKKERLKVTAENALEIWVNQPPVENKANAAVIKNLAKYFNVAQSAVVLRSGAHAKTKLFEIIGVASLPKERDLFSSI